jgi:hypothetical protein
VAIVTVAADGSNQTLPRTHRARRAAAAITAAALIAVLAFLAGEHHQRGQTVLTGVAGVGYAQQATVTVAGWTYAIEGTDNTWIDRQGMLHNGGWPACLNTPGRHVPITFAEVPVTAPDGSTTRQVLWIDCRP